MKKTALIMAGGKGERFWPRSRVNLPKQFLSLTDDGKTMIQLTVERISPLVDIEDVYIATNIKTTKWSTFVSLYNLHDGTQKELKVDKRTFTRNPLQQYDTIYAIIEERDKKKKVDGQWVSTGEKQSILANYRIVV